MFARRFFRHGFAMVLLSLCLGFAIPAVGGGARGRVWLAAHTTGILVGLLLVAAGAVWPSLRVGARAQWLAGFGLLTGAWAGFVFLGLLTSILSMPLAVAAPSLPPVVGWPQVVFGISLVYVSVTILGGCGIVLYGLRGED